MYVYFSGSDPSLRGSPSRLRITRIQNTAPHFCKKTIDGFYLPHDLSGMVGSLSNVMSRKYNCILSRWGKPGEFTLLLNFIK